MGFSVFDPSNRFEYAGTNLATLFAQKRQLFSFNHWRMLYDIIRFNKASLADLESHQLEDNESLGNYLKRNRYSDVFIHRYLIPMGSAIWSATQDDMQNFPVAFFIQFFKNHGLLNVVNRPQWRVIRGGSNAYIAPLIKPFADKIKLSSPVEKVIRHNDGITLTVNGIEEAFDQIIFACHSDQALAILGDASLAEKDILGAISYQKNSVILHTDTKLLPQRKKVWSSWNYQLQENKQHPPILTYSMNILQSIQGPDQFCVTLNAKQHINPKNILGEYEYAHPVFNRSALNAQTQWPLINGVNNTWYCGAYWFNGFHEDGVNSALRVVKALGVEP
jgi:predicted NAD/FAD-binding protein